MAILRQIRRVTLIAISLVGILIVITISLHATGRLDLKETIINGEPISDLEAASLGLRPGSSLLSQDCELVAQVMCRRTGIGSAEVELDFPDRILISANNSPIQFVALDESTNEVLGITNDLRVAPYDEGLVDSDAPVFLGLGALTLYEKLGDGRVATVVEALNEIHERSETWFSEISAIDFSAPEFVSVSFDTFRFPAICQPATIGAALESLFRLGANGTWPVEEVELIDLRYDDVVIVRGGDKNRSAGAESGVERKTKH